MIVLAISESHGESARRAAAVLDGYLPRMGRRTWCGNVSAEGLGDLRKALRSKATRATAVAIHRMLGNRRADLLCVVGNSSAFGPDGEVPVSVTRRPCRSADRTLIDELLASALLLAADFHDLGKLTAGFQEHLLDSACGRRPDSQPLRHEFVSLAVLRNAIDKSGVKSDAAFLEAIANPAVAAALFEAAFANLEDILKSSAYHESTEGVVCSTLPDNDFPFMRVVADLILSHHRLPAGKYRPPLAPLPGKKTAGGTGPLFIMDTRHVNRAPGKGKAPVKAFLVPAAACHKALRDPLWSGTVARDARRALSVMPGSNQLSWRMLFSGVAFSIGRLALMLGDHQGSASRLPSFPSAQPLRRFELIS